MNERVAFVPRNHETNVKASARTLLPLLQLETKHTRPVFCWTTTGRPSRLFWLNLLSDLDIPLVLSPSFTVVAWPTHNNHLSTP